jgi:hypothetical protein
MKTSTAVAVGVGGLVVLGAVAISFGHKELVQFTLKMDGPNCMPSDPETINSAKGRQVTWKVHNEDCDPQYVSLRNFRHDTDPPVDLIKPAPDSSRIDRGATVDITGKVDKSGFFTNYKYEIWVGPSLATAQMRRDPDLDVWPF